MNGHFKIPSVVKNGKRFPPRTAPPVNLHDAQLLSRLERSPRRNVAPQPKIGNSVERKLMDMDETLLNAVDLAAIEKKSLATQKRKPTSLNGVTSEPPVVSSPRRKKPRISDNIIVLDMCPKRSNKKSHSLEQDISRLDQKSNDSNIFSKGQFSMQRLQSTTFPPQNKKSSLLAPSRLSAVAGPSRSLPSTVVARKETSLELFPWDSHMFESQVERIVDGLPTAPEEADDVAKDVDDEEVFPCYQPADNSSQIFLDEVDRMGKMAVTHVGTPLKSNETFSIKKNPLLCSQYIRLERSMREENQANVIDDEVNSQLAQEFDSTQQRKDIESVYRQCERTLIDTSNIQLEEPPPTAMDAVAEVVADINWEEEVTLIGGMKSPAARKADEKSLLNSIFKKRNSLGASERVGSPKLTARKSAPLVSSHFQDKGPFFGLPSKVKALLRTYKGIEELYDWQKECLGLHAIVERMNLIYALPTSGGKTLVAEILMFREVMLRQKNTMFIVPYVSLAQEKIASLSPFAVSLDFLVEEYSGGKGTIPPRKRRKKQSIFVCTIEKALVLLNSLIETNRATEIGLVVIDELHMIGEERRGAHLEILLTKIQAIEAGIQVVGMSATIGNLNEIAKFISADIYCRDFRPVELKEYVKCGNDLLEINNKADRLEDAFGKKRTQTFNYSEEQRRIDPDHIIALVVEVIPSSSCLVFCSTKRQCEQLCALLTEYLPEELLTYKQKEKEELINSLKRDGSTAALLPTAFQFGIAYHHSGLTFDERKHIEDAYRAGIISLIICTSTLAAGVNLPAKRVIIRSPFIATNFLTLSRYKQMVGRAGRAGLGEPGDSILICSPKDITAVCNLLCSPMDEAISSLHIDEGVYLKNFILSAVGLGICSSRNDIQRIVTKTLLAIQAERLEINIRKMTDRAILSLYKENAIKAKSDGCLRNPANMTIRIDGTEDDNLYDFRSTGVNEIGALNVARGAEGSSQEGKLVKTVNKNARLEVNRLGKAAIRSGFHMEKATKFYDELKRVGERLYVLDDLHLLYVIVMEDGSEIRPSDSDYVTFFNQLSLEETKIAKRFHIGDFTISKILSKRLVPPETLPTVRRYYRVLIVNELLNLTAPQQVALKFKVDAGSIQTLMTNVASTASGLQRMCEELPELKAFQQLLMPLVQRLSHCCTAELIPLMELPGVKLARARQLHRAGFTSLVSIANAKSRNLVESVEHMNYRAANQLILSAKEYLILLTITNHF
ncbi:helicase POLQ-like isoform X2 [Wyeomyia smithii]|uniref:helicase POLQ-like isoform X2 n=1 Tax=Wyeomyia smithii TaxID=174621 RepID=UPI002467C58E|nr:helicase POLQ-like isoform X2 [Wyeomyia smithii]